jgi:predicted nuclease of predicted toxin-antitoxin system
MRLLLDQGLPHSTVHHLDAAGIESVHVGEKGLAAASDAKIIDFARQGGWIVVTLDADFHALLALSGATGAFGLKVNGLQGAMISVTENGARIRRLPLLR